jgi:uncharacterized protein
MRVRPLSRTWPRRHAVPQLRSPAVQALRRHRTIVCEVDASAAATGEVGSSVTWVEHTVNAASGMAWRVPAGGFLRVTDVEGGQTGDLFLVDAADRSDGLSNGRSFDYNGSVLMSVCSKLYSSRSNVLATIISDDVGRHDFLYTPCSQEMYEIQHGAMGPHPNCYDNLTSALARYGVPASTVTVALNVFMFASIADDGGLIVHPTRSIKGDSIVLRLERDVLAAVTSCPAAGCNRGAPQPLLVSIGATGAPLDRPSGP